MLATVFITTLTHWPQGQCMSRSCHATQSADRCQTFTVYTCSCLVWSHHVCYLRSSTSGMCVCCEDGDFDSTTGMLSGSMKRINYMVNSGKSNRKLMCYVIVGLVLVFLLLFYVISSLRASWWWDSPFTYLLLCISLLLCIVSTTVCYYST